MFNEIIKERKKKEDEAADKILVDLWGYQLPLMENPISFKEFRDNAYKVTDTTLRKEDSEETHDMKIQRIRKAEALYRERRG